MGDNGIILADGGERTLARTMVRFTIPLTRERSRRLSWAIVIGIILADAGNGWSRKAPGRPVELSR